MIKSHRLSETGWAKEKMSTVRVAALYQCIHVLTPPPPKRPQRISSKCWTFFCSSITKLLRSSKLKNVTNFVHSSIQKKLGPHCQTFLGSSLRLAQKLHTQNQCLPAVRTLSECIIVLMDTRHISMHFPYLPRLAEPGTLWLVLASSRGQFLLHLRIRLVPTASSPWPASPCSKMTVLIPSLRSNRSRQVLTPHPLNHWLFPHPRAFVSFLCSCRVQRSCAWFPASIIATHNYRSHQVETGDHSINKTFVVLQQGTKPHR